MLEPPDLADGAIVSALDAYYGLAVQTLTFLPVGNDAATWVYRVGAAGGGRFFLKVRAGNGFRVASLAVPHTLQQKGVAHVMAPLPTVSGTQWVTLEAFTLALYPFVAGRMGADGGLTSEQWRAFGALIKQVHGCRLPEAVRGKVRRETFVPGDRGLVERLDEAVEEGRIENGEARAFAAFWRERWVLTRAVTARADALGAALRESGAKTVLCHGDMHPWNILVEEDGAWWLVDWDEVTLAPKERDLMFAIGGIGDDGVGEAQTAAFLDGYGDEDIDRLALAYYRAAWAVQDIAAFGRDVLFAPQLGAVSRRAALEGFMGLFGEGSIVGRALEGTDLGNKGS